MKRTLALVLALVMTMALVACGGNPGTSNPGTSNPDTSEPKQPADITDIQQGGADIKEGVEYVKDLVIALDGQNTSMDPQAVSNFHHDTQFNVSHNQLVSYDWSTKTMEPELATEWSVSDDGLTWTFKLRDDVVFHNGEKMTADDVVFTFERAKATGVAGTTAYEQIDSVTANGDYEVSMKLVAPNADWLYLLMYTYNSILNREAVEADANHGAEIGTGGFKIAKWEVNTTTKMERFDDSWVWNDNALTPTETLTFMTMAEASARAIALQTGEAHVGSVELTEVPLLEKDDGVKLLTMNSETIFFLGFNNEVGPTTDVNLRKAIAYAVNPQDILDGYYEGYGNVCKSFWGPNQYGLYTDYSDPLEYNLEKAKEYMAKSNYPNGLDLELTILAAAEEYGALIQYHLKQIGINVTVNTVDSAGLKAVAKAKEFDFFFYNKSCGPHGDQFRSILTYGNGTNRGHFNNARVMELLDLAIVETDDAKRLAMYQEIQQITHDEMPYRPMYYGVGAYAYNAKASGMIWAGNAKHDYTFLVVEK